MKKFLSGLILGVTITVSTVPVVAKAKEYILTQSTSTIAVNGEKYTNTDKPILDYKGATYVPLRNFTELVGSELAYDNATGVINIKTKKSPSTKPDYYYDDANNYILNYDGKAYILFSSINDNYLKPNFTYVLDEKNKVIDIVEYNNSNNIIVNDIQYIIYEGRPYMNYSLFKTDILPKLK